MAQGSDVQGARDLLLFRWLDTNRSSFATRRTASDDVFETMTAVAVTGLLRTSTRDEAALLLRTLAEQIDRGNKDQAEALLRRLSEGTLRNARRSRTSRRRPLPGPRSRSAPSRDKLPLVAQASQAGLINRRSYDTSL